MRFFKQKLALQAVFLGTLLGGGLLYAAAWPLVVVGAVGFFILQDQCVILREKLLIAWAVGSLKSLIVLLWFSAALPLSWLGEIPVVTQWLLFGGYVIPAAITLGSGFCLVALVYGFMRSKSMWLMMVVAGTTWVAAELIGAFIFSIYVLGPGSALNGSFSFGFSGYALTQHALFYSLAEIGGIYPLSFVVGALGMGGALLCAKKQQWFWLAMLLVLATSFVSLPTSTTLSSDVSLAVVQTYFTLDSREGMMTSEARKAIVLEAVDAALTSQRQYILLPEDTRFTTYFPNQYFALQYIESVVDADVVMVDSGRIETVDGTHLRTYIYDTAADAVYSYDKAYLVPQGEYVPYVYNALLSAFGGETYTTVLENNTYRPGIAVADVSVPNYVPAVLFCFESVAPTGVHTAIAHRHQPPFIAHIVSHAWFQRIPHTLWHQLDTMLQVQARFNQAPIVQAANQAPLKVYYPDGTIVYPEITQSGEGWALAEFSL